MKAPHTGSVFSKLSTYIQKRNHPSFRIMSSPIIFRTKKRIQGEGITKKMTCQKEELEKQEKSMKFLMIFGNQSTKIVIGQSSRSQQGNVSNINRGIKDSLHQLDSELKW